MKITEPARLRIRLHRTGDDSFKIISGLNFQRAHHRVRSLADRNHQHAVVGMQIVKVFAHAQHAALTTNIALECLINTGFAKSAFEKMPRRNPHLDGKSFAVGRSSKTWGRL